MEILISVGVIALFGWVLYLGKKQTDARKAPYEFDPYGESSLQSCSHMNPAHPKNSYVMPLHHEIVEIEPLVPKPNRYKDLHLQNWRDN
jgi:hypothetical protein